MKILFKLSLASFCVSFRRYSSWGIGQQLLEPTAASVTPWSGAQVAASPLHVKPSYVEGWKMNERLVTIVGSSFFEPIAMLYAELESASTGEPGGVQSSPRENGYAVSVCILAVACLESYVMRVRYLNNPDDLGLSEKQASKYLTGLYPNFPYEAETKELFIHRDALVHNHLWEIEYSYGDDAGLIQHSFEKKSPGDKKYRFNVGKDGQATRKLGLRVNPIRVGRSDARTVLCIVWRILQFLETENHNQCGVSYIPIYYKGEGFQMSELMEKLEEFA